MSSILTLTALIATLITIGYLYVKNAFSYWKRRGVPYIHPSFPFGNLGDIFLQKTSFSEGIRKIHESFNGPVVGIYSLFRPALLLRDPKIIREILIKEFPSFHHRGIQANEGTDPMAGNILLQNGEKWKNARRNFSPAFTSGKLKGMFENIISCTNSLNNYVSQFADKPKSVEMRELFARFATNVIASVAFGIDIDCIENPNCKFRQYGKRFFDPTFKNAFRGFLAFFSPKLAKILRVRFTDKDVGDFMIETVKQNLEYREKNNVSRKDFFQLLIQFRNSGEIDDNNDWSAKQSNKAKSLSLEEMSAQAYLFFSAGYETSSTTMSFCAYELARNPAVQQKTYDSIETILENHDGKLTYEALSEMTYIDNVVAETLRMHPPLGNLGRQCMKDYKIAGTDIVIEKGTPVYFSVEGIQYEEQYYEQPNTFWPERFDERRNGNKTSLEMPFLSFGDGPRNCLGLRLAKLQTKLAIITLLQKYRFELDDQHQNKEIELNPQSFTKYPMNGINLKVFTR